MSTKNNWIEVIQQLNNNQEPDEQLLRQLSREERELIEALQKDKMIVNAHLLLGNLNEKSAWTSIRSNFETKNIGLFPKLLRHAAIWLLPLFAVGGGILYHFKYNQPVELAAAKLQPTDHNRATLVLANGSTVELSAKSNQKLGEVAGTSIVNHQKNLLTYQQNRSLKGGDQLFNKLIIPRGAEYKLALADGSLITINSASILRFPVNFNAATSRNVFLEKGEAYFQVAKNPHKPFIVHANGMDIKVLGTTFNVNTYKKDLRTTLVEGRVEASNSNGQKVVLNPSQEAILNKQNGTLVKADVDVTPVVAWANGKIVFEESTLDEVMEELGLWYDYDVEFVSAQIKEIHFSGELEKYKDIKQILSIIEQTGGVKFSIKGRRIYVDQR
ncbi:hypothetical protein DBR11_18270 [Pedobacter sp. HMWF019]|uniref:FecR family protein n=1 Tax=Pedobacter sp. HMWF019 TaxID=2056856 RepID=UPI000D364F48|nr:FecR domain-containing protein [Pedobacter sp. HMWF019]PTS96979.1 hypothetical protein DBR11_18270 [Pedobacter sp. HMWF019]